jgi:phage I-like protein
MSTAIQLSASGKLPTEFRIFKRGVNSTEKGDFVFDETAAKSVMASREKWGVDCMIDLEHGSIEVEPGAADPNARDARGWCRLELRNGELWATQVSWTPDGAARLRARTQRYVSPVFENDPDTKQILRVVNVAITALPATRNAPALVAASVRRGAVSPELRAAARSVARRELQELAQRVALGVEHPKGVDDGGAAKQQPAFKPAPNFPKNGATPTESNPKDTRGWESVLYISSAEAKWGPTKK